MLLSRYSTPAYGDGYVYSDQAIIIAIIIALTPIFGMIGIAIKEAVNTKGGLKEVHVDICKICFDILLCRWFAGCYK